MKNFNELFEIATEVSDRRKKVFNELIEKTKVEILPLFCDACAKFGLKKVYFKFEEQIISDTDAKSTGVDEYQKYCISIDVNSREISDCDFHPYEGYFMDKNYINFNDLKLTKCGIIPFVKALNNRLEVYIEKYSKLNEIAENLNN